MTDTNVTIPIRRVQDIATVMAAHPDGHALHLLTIRFPDGTALDNNCLTTRQVSDLIVALQRQLAEALEHGLT